MDMDTPGPTLRERALRTYRRLLVLERVFLRTVRLPREPDTSEDEAELCAGVREILAELAEDTRALSTVPLPLSEWRQGDGPYRFRRSRGRRRGLACESCGHRNR